MTSRRTMLKWLPAACLGGWWGLGRKAAAAADSSTPPPSARPIKLHYEYDCQPSPGGTKDSYCSVTCTYHPDGRLLSETPKGGQTCAPNGLRQIGILGNNRSPLPLLLGIRSYLAVRQFNLGVVRRARLAAQTARGGRDDGIVATRNPSLSRSRART